MKPVRFKCLVVFVCLLSLLLPCTPQVLGDDAKVRVEVGGVGGADVDGAVGGGHERGAGEEASVALHGISEERSTGRASDSGEFEGEIRSADGEVEGTNLNYTEGAGESDGFEVEVQSADGEGERSTSKYTGGAGESDEFEGEGQSAVGEGESSTHKYPGGAGESDKFDPQNIIICAFFMGNPQGAHLEQLSQMFHSARFVHGPKSRLMVVTDEESQFQIGHIHEDLEITRFTIDEEKFKFNIGSGKIKNHLSLMPKRVAFESFLLEKLHKEGNKTNVVFVDTDLLFLRSVADMFSNNDFDVAMTFRKPIPGRAHTAFLARQEPVNLGIKFANGNGLALAFAFWQKALETWDKSTYAKCNDCDQQAFSDAGELASSDKRLRNKYPFVNEVNTDAGTARIRYVHCSYFNSYPSKGNCGPSTFSHVLHFKGDLKTWMPKVYGMIKGEVLALVDADAEITATHSVTQHMVKQAANAYASFYSSSKKKKRG